MTAERHRLARLAVPLTLFGVAVAWCAVAYVAGDRYQAVAPALLLLGAAPFVSAAAAPLIARDETRRWRAAAIAFAVSVALSIVGSIAWVATADKLCGDRIDCPR